jgi:hypothetical protein
MCTVMKYGVGLLIATLSLAGVPAQAQEVGAGPGTMEVTVIPGGGMFFTGSDAESKFHNYNVGGAFTYHINRLLGVEGEVAGTLGMTQTLAFGGLSSSQKTPNTFGYTGNLVVSAPVRHRIVPYVTGGLGGLTLFSNTGLAINQSATFLTTNVGGGVKWYANDRWGLRGDYRFVTVRSSDTAPAFFGQETRYGNRIYGGFVLNVAR